MAQPDVTAVDAFWSWWSDRFRDYLGAAIEENRVEQVADPLAGRLHKVHPSLLFDVRPGASARFALVIGAAEGCPDGIVEQVLQRAPAADDRWEYGPADAPIPDPRELALKAGDRAIDLARMRVGMNVDDRAKVLELAVYHPELGDVAEEDQYSVATTAMNAVAGHAPPLQHRTKLRLTCVPPEDGVDLAELRDRLAQLDQAQLDQG